MDLVQDRYCPKTRGSPPKWIVFFWCSKKVAGAATTVMQGLLKCSSLLKENALVSQKRDSYSTPHSHNDQEPFHASVRTQFFSADKDPLGGPFQAMLWTQSRELPIVPPRKKAEDPIAQQ